LEYINTHQRIAKYMEPKFKSVRVIQGVGLLYYTKEMAGYNNVMSVT
jgi:hypothetical protein